MLLDGIASHRGEQAKLGDAPSRHRTSQLTTFNQENRLQSQNQEKKYQIFRLPGLKQRKLV